jgi:hypothetical protein
MRLRRAFYLTPVMLAVLVTPCRAAFLDGTVGQVQVVPDKTSADKGEKEFSDKFTFADGKFSSEFFAGKGFKPSVYRGETEANEAEFEVEQASESQGVITWLGEIRGKRLIGRLIWRRKDGMVLNFDFEGTKN